MELYEVSPIFQNPKKEIVVTVPGSKSITNRALLLAALSKGKCKVKGILFSDDSRHFLQCLKDLGFEVEVSEEKKEATVTGCGGLIPKKEAKIYVGSAGTAARFLTAMLGMSDGTYEIDASEQMKKRPMDGLFDSLEQLGAKIQYHGQKGYLPVTIGNQELTAKEVTVDIEKSSQFLSALMIASCKCKEDFTIHIKGNHGMAYIDLTARMMEQFGGKIEKINDRTYQIPRQMFYEKEEYQVEPDVSAACYFYAMAPLLGRDVLVKNVHLDSTQGDLAFVRLMEQLGCKLKDTEEGIFLKGLESCKYQGVEVDMGAFSDQTMTLAALAPFAQTPTKITGIGHIRYQESNRIEAVAKELTRLGIQVEEQSDGLIIYPGIVKPAVVETYDDHRMAMAFTLIGLRQEGIKITNPKCCGKTFENYFEIIDRLK